jgi:hypothetical protein
VLFGLATVASGFVPLYIFMWLLTFACAAYVQSRSHPLRSDGLRGSARTAAVSAPATNKEDSVGLFSRSKTLGTVAILFADENTASVTTTNDGNWKIDIQLFCWYYARVVTNLGALDDTARQLVEVIDEAIRQAFKEGTVQGSLLPEHFQLKELLELPPTKLCQGELNRSSDGQITMSTSFSHGGEGYFAPMSVMAFLQHLLSTMTTSRQGLLWLTLIGMHKYYNERGWTHIQSTNEAPWAGIEFAQAATQRNSEPAAT